MTNSPIRHVGITASFTADPVDLLEPEVFEENNYRECAVRLTLILECVDTPWRTIEMPGWHYPGQFGVGFKLDTGPERPILPLKLGLTKQAVFPR